ncbi:protein DETOXIFICATION 46, chloroplastic-like isoform X2 [Corylus avellana]|uniref:protein DETOXIFICATION 46, chloroplastic-like isoform X2 n=1 Tax=Corylus avellana TaxID=13451 RepID=UPI00286C4509|nr:protein DETOXIFICATION 46, chloroplastic-like isoform X2 [Corylus avellana]
MQLKTLIARPSHTPLFQNPTQRPLSLFPRFHPPFFPSNLSLSSTLKSRRNRITTACINPSEELIDNDPKISGESDGDIVSVSEKLLGVVEGGESGSEEGQSIWNQMVEIVKFSGPATGLWICGPLMSLIDTVVIGQGSSIELAALGPATVLCDNLSYVFMFLSIATSNMVATSLARKDKNEVQHHISNLLFIGLTCGCLMLLFTKFFGSWALTAFTGPKNAHVVPAANTYVQIRGLAWPAILIGWVAQSASLGMKDSWGPLKALAVASVVNGIGDIVLCSFLGYGIAGAAWATMASQVIAGYMMIETLNKKGYNAFAISVPSTHELLTVFGLAAPVFVTMMSKVAFFSLLTYFATSVGTHTMAAHQVMVQTFLTCTVWGEPLSQTAQSFMPELIYGARRNLEKAQMLLKSLVIIGAILGLLLGIVGTCVPWLFPKIYTHDQNVIQEMHTVLIPFFLALAITPPTLSLEGTLLAGRDLKFISLSMSGCFSICALLLLLVNSRGYGLPGCWFGLVAFQWARFFLSLRRLLSPNGILDSDDSSQYNLEKLRAT